VAVSLLGQEHSSSSAPAHTGSPRIVTAPGTAPAVWRVIGLRAAGQAGLARHDGRARTAVLLHLLSLLLVLLLSGGGPRVTSLASLARGARAAAARGCRPAAALPRCGRLARQLLRQLALQRLDLGDARGVSDPTLL